MKIEMYFGVLGVFCIVNLYFECCLRTLLFGSCGSLLTSIQRDFTVGVQERRPVVDTLGHQNIGPNLHRLFSRRPRPGTALTHTSGV